jgi:hypothetical protein
MSGKKVDYLPFLRLLSFETHGIAVGCKLTIFVNLQNSTQRMLTW